MGEGASRSAVAGARRHAGSASPRTVKTRKSVGIPVFPDPARALVALVLIGLSIVIFVIARVMPGDPARMALGPRASQEQVDDLKRKMGLDMPLVEQYQHFVVGLSRGDLGLSFLTKRPVNDDIAETFAATFELVLVTIAIAFVVGVPLGVVAAANKDGWVDNLVRLVAIFGAVTPSFLLALLLQVLAGYVLHVLPTTGRHYAGCADCRQLTGLLLIDTLLKGNLAGFFDALKHLLSAEPRAVRGDGRPDRAHHALLDDRRRAGRTISRRAAPSACPTGSACSNICCGPPSCRR